MITSLPAILGYAIDNIRTKISDLETLGFRDPVKMITSLPAILGYAIDNIRTKISDLETLGFRDPVKMITSSPVLLAYSRERLLLCCAIVGRLDDFSGSDDDARRIVRLIFLKRNLIDAVAAAAPETWRDVLYAVKELRR
jgi:hypothetical protein